MSAGSSWAGLALFRLVEGVPEVFLARRAVRLQRGLWSITGGGVNEGESFVDAAFRELGEEAMGMLKPEGRGLEGASTRHGFRAPARLVGFPHLVQSAHHLRSGPPTVEV